MRCFVKGFFGALIVLIAAATTYPQYADYATSAQTSSWIQQVEPVKEHISANAQRSHTLTNSGLGAKRPDFANPPAYFEVTKDGAIFIQGGREGQLIVFVPTLTDTKVSWRCIGGSRKATLGCKSS